MSIVRLDADGTPTPNEVGKLRVAVTVRVIYMDIDDFDIEDDAAYDTASENAEAELRRAILENPELIEVEALDIV